MSTPQERGKAFRFPMPKSGSGSVTVVGKFNGGGLAQHRIEIPESTRLNGFDEIRIRGRNGDGSYSLGHLILA